MKDASLFFVLWSLSVFENTFAATLRSNIQNKASARSADQREVRHFHRVVLCERLVRDENYNRLWLCTRGLGCNFTDMPCRYARHILLFALGLCVWDCQWPSQAVNSELKELASRTYSCLCAANSFYIQKLILQGSGVSMWQEFLQLNTSFIKSLCSDYDTTISTCNSDKKIKMMLIIVKRKILKPFSD